MKDLWKKAKGLIAKIALVDRFLMLFMLILLLYTAINLFTDATNSQNSNMVDIIVRTSAAAIFGYFISSNFVKTNTTNSTTVSYSNNLSIPTQANEENLNIQPKNQIGFVTSADTTEAEPGKATITEASSDQTSCSKLQIIIVSFIGICSLVLLFITKFFIPATSEVSATASQLRDFVSACIGFLVSCGRTK